MEEKSRSEMEEELDAMKERLRVYEDVPAETQLVVEGYEWHGKGLSRHCRYIVSRFLHERKVSVYRRFSDVVSLQKILVREFPGRVIASHPEKVYVNLSEEVCRERVEWIQAFLDAIHLHDTVRESEWVRHFLIDQTEVWQNRLDQLPTTSPQGIVSQYKQNVTRFLGLDSVQDTAATESESTSGSVLEEEKDSAISNTSPSHSGALKSMVSAFSDKIWSAASSGSIDIASHFAVSPAALESYQQFVHDYEWLTNTSKPLEVNLPSLGGGSSEQNVKVKLESANGRVAVLSRLSEAFLHFVEHVDDQASRTNSLGTALLDLDNADTFAQEDERKLNQVWSTALHQLCENKVRFVRQCKSRHDSHASLQLVLRSFLTIEGCKEMFERCQVELQDACKKEESVEQIWHTSGRFETLCEDLVSTNKQTKENVARAAVRFAQVNIEQAKENQRVLKDLLAFLQQNDTSGTVAKRMESNRNRLGLGRSRNTWQWDVDTPM